MVSKPGSFKSLNKIGKYLGFYMDGSLKWINKIGRHLGRYINGSQSRGETEKEIIFEPHKKVARLEV